MASQGYRDWVKAGKPYHLVDPARALVSIVQRYGITVYHYPNDAHLQANTPEDHTPFSVTGWPGKNARWNARGVDIMPRGDTYADRKENADIARQLIRDRDAGVPGVMWIKYLNWTDEGNVCQQVRWTDAANPLRHTTRSSTDRGHIHISGRSDIDDDDRADGYDPIARMRGIAPAGGSDMSWNDLQKVNASFNNEPVATLDTDGTIDGKGNLQAFPNKTYVAIQAQGRQIEALTEQVKRLAAVGVGAGLTADEVRAIVREELGHAEIVPGTVPDTPE